MKYLIISYLLVLGLISFLFGHLIYKNKMKNDLLFFVFVNFILVFSFLIFFFYYKDYVFSIVNMIFLFLNTLFLFYEIKLTKDKYFFLAIPYVIYIIVILILLLINF
ncbi:MAG TPA: tryptophan-rich sensory protein [Candidatus Coprovivens excrementavium]|nr:tryptophan-rich sensory protein [Candidatus Coprovivens excrementavium]